METRRELWSWAALAAVVALICWLAVPAVSRDMSHWGRLVIAAMGVVLVGVRVLISWIKPVSKPPTPDQRGLLPPPPPKSRALRGLHGVMVALCTIGWFNYYQFDGRIFRGINDYTDITYYYLNSKYLDELGFYGFYAAMITADSEMNNRHNPHIRQYRDLRDDTLKPLSVALEHGREIEATQFTPEGWEAFRRDTNYFLSRISTPAFRDNFYVDHGYNPPPTWAIVGGPISEAVPVRYLKAIACIDVVLVIGMFAGIAWGFGWEPMLWAMLFFVCTFSGRWPILGQALLRFDWLAALAVGMAALRKQRWGLAGGLLAYAALNRVFPAIFLGAWLWAFVADVWRERRIPRHHLRFAGAALAVVVVLGGAAFARYGRTTFEESAHNLAMHNRSFSSHRIGLGGLLVWDGDTTRAEIKAGGGMAAKEIAVQRMMPGLQVAGVLAIGLVAAAAVRSRRDAWETLPWLLLPFFVLTNPQANYYNLRIVAVILHSVHLGVQDDRAPGADRLFHRVGLALLLGIEVAAQWAFVSNWERHGVNSLASVGMAIWCAMLMAWLVLQVARGWRPEQRTFPAPKPASA